MSAGIRYKEAQKSWNSKRVQRLTSLLSSSWAMLYASIPRPEITSSVHKQPTLPSVKKVPLAGLFLLLLDVGEKPHEACTLYRRFDRELLARGQSCALP